MYSDLCEWCGEDEEDGDHDLCVAALWVREMIPDEVEEMLPAS